MQGTKVATRMETIDSLFTPIWVYPGHGTSVNRDEILRVLERAADDPAFIAELTYRPTQALSRYHLTRQEKAALTSGDIAWIEKHMGKLNKQQRTWLDCRLQQEIW